MYETNGTPEVPKFISIEQIELSRATFIEIHKGKDAEETLAELYNFFSVYPDDVL